MKNIKEVTEEDNAAIKWLIENFLQLEWEKPTNVAISSESYKDMVKILDEKDEWFKKQVEIHYINRLLLKLNDCKKFTEKYPIYRFLFVDIPLKKLSGFIRRNKFRLYDILPEKERNFKDTSHKIQCYL